MTEVFLNGQPYRSEPDVTILQAARQAGIAIPTLCSDSRLGVIGSCRICCVDVDGDAHPQIACHTKIREGMRIETHSKAIEAYRREILALLAAHVTPKSFAAEPDKELHRMMRAYSIAPGADLVTRSPRQPLWCVRITACERDER